MYNQNISINGSKITLVEVDISTSITAALTISVSSVPTATIDLAKDYLGNIKQAVKKVLNHAVMNSDQVKEQNLVSKFSEILNTNFTYNVDNTLVNSIVPKVIIANPK